MSDDLCNADQDHPCDGGPDGEPCPGCKVWRVEMEARFRAEYDRTPAVVRRLNRMTEDEKDAELVEAGRGHLVLDHLVRNEP